MRAEAEALVRSLGLQEQVQFTGYVPESQVDQHYSSSDCLLFPTYHDEGVPLVKAPPPPKPARRWVEPPPPAPPAPSEDATFTPNLDAAALAKVLRDAAQAGVPFCEECEKARQAQSRTAAPVV